MFTFAELLITACKRLFHYVILLLISIYISSILWTLRIMRCHYVFSYLQLSKVFRWKIHTRKKVWVTQWACFIIYKNAVRGGWMFVNCVWKHLRFKYLLSFRLLYIIKNDVKHCKKSCVEHSHPLICLPIHFTLSSDSHLVYLI